MHELHDGTESGLIVILSGEGGVATGVLRESCAEKGRHDCLVDVFERGLGTSELDSDSACFDIEPLWKTYDFIIGPVIIDVQSTAVTIVANFANILIINMAGIGDVLTAPLRMS